jgi:signal transduction histidine kinase
MLLRLVQEGLSNIQRHSGSTRALIHIRQVRDRLHVVIRDNGRGTGSTGPCDQAAELGHGCAHRALRRAASHR